LKSDVTLNGVTITVPEAKYSYTQITQTISSITVPVKTNFSLITTENTSTDSSTVSITNNANRQMTISNSGIITTLNN